MPPPFQRKSNTAFTLFELLITLAVIAILLVLLAKGLHELRKRGHHAKCVSHLRQCGMVFNAYASDHNGRFPENTNLYPSNTVSEASEISTIGSTGWRFAPSAFLAEGYVQDLNIFFCPAQKRYTFPDRTTSYGLQGWAREGYYIGYMLFYLRNYTANGDKGFPELRNARITDDPMIPQLSDFCGHSVHGDIVNVLHLNGAITQVSEKRVLGFPRWGGKGGGIEYMMGR